MEVVTQGTLISGIRSTKYPTISTYSIIISAACDLAQQKIDKVFYLTAIPLKEWLYSERGFQTATSNIASNTKSKLCTVLSNYGLSWEAIQNFSSDDFNKVINETISKESDKKQAKDSFEKYQQIVAKNLSRQEKGEVYLSNSKAVVSILETIFNGNHSHFVFIPETAISAPIQEKSGLIVDLLEVDYLSSELVKKIANADIDCKVLPSPDLEKYDKQFFLKEGIGFAYPAGEIVSPWREYVLQHFSNCFIRIGVDNPRKADIESMIKNLFQKENQA